MASRKLSSPARQVDVIVATGGNPPIQASIELTSTTPIVAVFGDDPVKRKMIASLERPGGNLTGVSLLARDIEIKCLQLIRQIVPGASSVGLIIDPLVPASVELESRFQSATAELGLQGVVVHGRAETEIDEAFATLVERRIDSLLVASTAYFLDRRDRFVALAARSRIPAVYTARPYVDAGGLLSYGVERLEIYRQLGRYTGTVLNGGIPAEMPILPPSKFELVVNTKTAKALGLTFPQSLLALADAII